MKVYQVNVAITTTRVVTVKADNEENASHKAINEVQNLVGGIERTGMILDINEVEDEVH